MSSFLHQWILFLAESPALRLMQFSLLAVSTVLIYIVFFTTRDILFRTNSLLYQFASILLVAVLPVVGFLLYLLMRPARTIKERELEMLLRQLLGNETKKNVQMIRLQEKVTKVHKKPHATLQQAPALADRQSSDSSVSSTLHV